MPSLTASALVAALSLAAGDRVFAKAGAVLRREPTPTSPVVRALDEGNELALAEPPVSAEADLRGGPLLPRGWLFVQTIDVPSGRSFVGFLPASAAVDEAPTPSRRAAVLRHAVEVALEALAARRAPFQTLREEIAAWQAKAQTDPHARAQASQLSDRLATYMEAEVGPLLLDLEDDLAELRDLGDPKSPALARRFEQSASAFRP